MYPIFFRSGRFGKIAKMTAIVVGKSGANVLSDYVPAASDFLETT
jgi:hypothetical protein